jgi:hypothetical protein
MTPSRPPQTRLRRLRVRGWHGVVMYAAVELRSSRRSRSSSAACSRSAAFEAQRREVNAGEDPFGMADVPARLRIHKEVVHPYMGYVYDPNVEQSSPYGISDATPIRHRSDGKVIVGLFGGSFADDISYNMAGELADKLKPSFPGASSSW